ncbi:MAG TPA: sugar ABC transporter permease [Ktedonobacteraceae bacterium]|nr:sugar ABC transporter permease [Ktedonobacteraceae bacterium]
MSSITNTITPATEAARKAPPPSDVRRHNLAGWLFATPWVVIFVVFMAFPIIASLILSFTDFGIANLQDPFNLHFIGLQNYGRLAHDQLFLTAALNTIIVVVIGVPLNVGLALLIAIGVNRGVRYVRAIFRVGYYLPVVTSIVAIAVVWRFLLDPDAGLVDNLLRLVGLHGPNWLGDPSLALPSVIFVVIWRNVGYAMVILLAGLQGVDPTLYEAAHIDGAGAFARFRYVTIPMMRPVLLFVTVITSIGFLQVFQEPYVMTQGGPLNRTLTISQYLIQQGFDFFNQGYASAMAYVLFLAIVILTLVQFRLLRPQT